MADTRGKPVHGEIHATALTTAVNVPFYEAGAGTSGGGSAITLASGERLVITDAWFISDTAADVYLFLSHDSDATLEVGETVIRGTVAANGGVAKSFDVTHRVGSEGATARIGSGTSAIVDIGFNGYILTV
jgi:hypothetical protein